MHEKIFSKFWSTASRSRSTSPRCTVIMNKLWYFAQTAIFISSNGVREIKIRDLFKSFKDEKEREGNHLHYFRTPNVTLVMF